jgi:hypothetical protein
LKHGAGRQVHPDGAIYVGEFAKGYEHGSGEMTYKDGSVYQGKYRYGRRDGQGVFITQDGVKTKGVFRDNEGYTEKPPPTISEEILDDDSLFQPSSLVAMCIQSLSQVMQTHRHIYPAKRVNKRLHGYLKPLVTNAYLNQFPHIQQQNLLKLQQKQLELQRQQKQQMPPTPGRRSSVMSLPVPPVPSSHGKSASSTTLLSSRKQSSDAQSTGSPTNSLVIYEFASGMERIAMQNEEIIWFSGIKLMPEDIETLCYFEGNQCCSRKYHFLWNVLTGFHAHQVLIPS